MKKVVDSGDQNTPTKNKIGFDKKTKEIQYHFNLLLSKAKEVIDKIALKGQWDFFFTACKIKVPT